MKHLSPWTRNTGVPAVFNDFDRIFDNFWATAPATVEANFMPACDIEETNDHYVVSFDVPGIKREDIEIEVKDNHLWVRGERKKEENKVADGYQRYERSYGQFQRAFALPKNVEAEGVEANYKDGELHVLIPKATNGGNKTVEIKDESKEGFFDKVFGKKED